MQKFYVNTQRENNCMMGKMCFHIYKIQYVYRKIFRGTTNIRRESYKH